MQAAQVHADRGRVARRYHLKTAGAWSRTLVTGAPLRARDKIDSRQVAQAQAHSSAPPLPPLSIPSHPPAPTLLYPLAYSPAALLLDCQRHAGCPSVLRANQNRPAHVT